MAGTLLLGALLGWPLDAAAESPNAARTDPPHVCPEGETLATGRADPAIFAREASRGVAAFWCETYDRDGHAHRVGPYWDHHPDGSLRTRARYVEGRIEGPVEVYDEDGTLWLRGVLEGGAWSGSFELFHANGRRWLGARFRDGRVDGSVEIWSSDGRLQATIEPSAESAPPLPMARIDPREPDRGRRPGGATDPTLR